MSLRRRTRAIVITAMVMGVAACGSADDGAAPADTVPPTSSAATLSTAAPPPATATSSTLAATDTSESATTGLPSTGETGESGEAGDSEPVPISVEIPTGSLGFGPDDVIVAERTGDLVVYRGLLAGVSDRRELLADYPDPTGPVTEGPGPNAIDDVAGVVDGTLVFGDCCEPISGNVLVATGDPAAVRPISPGYGPTLSPDGAQLASASSMAIQRSSTSDGAGVARLLDHADRAGGFLNVDDIAWVDDERLALLGWDDQGYALFPVDAETLTIGEAVRFDAGDEEDGLALVRFAGRAPDGELAVMVAGTDGTQVRYFRTTDLREDPTMGGVRSRDVRAVQRTPGGTGELWVQDGTLWFLPDAPPAPPEPTLIDPAELLDGVNAAWFPAGR